MKTKPKLDDANPAVDAFIGRAKATRAERRARASHRRRASPRTSFDLPNDLYEEPQDPGREAASPHERACRNGSTRPDRQEMRRAAAESLKALGMERHQAPIVSHRGTGNRTCLANRGSPRSIGRAIGRRGVGRNAADRSGTLAPAAERRWAPAWIFREEKD